MGSLNRPLPHVQGSTVWQDLHDPCPPGIYNSVEESGIEQVSTRYLCSYKCDEFSEEKDQVL